MKILHSSVFRALCAVAVGILLVINPDSTVKGITITIGIIFLVSGVISCLAYLVARRQYIKEISQETEETAVPPVSPFFPIVGIGSLILGFILALMPETFMQWLMYLLGSMVILGAISQFAMLIGASKFCKLGFGFWIFPVLLLLAGIYIILQPLATASASLFAIGVCLIVYGLSESINSMAIHRERKKFRQLTKVENTYTEYEETP